MLRLHVTTVVIDGRGVMIEGASGSGKSDLALRLIDRGAILVSDDYTEVVMTNAGLLARPPATIAGKLEVRGVGIISLPHREDACPALLVTLGQPERLPEPAWREVLGARLPCVTVDAFTASAPIKVEIALRELGAA